MWLFHFRIGKDSNKNNAHGLGHAKRCLSIAKKAKKKGLNFKIISSNNQKAERFFKSENIEYFREENLEKILSTYKFSVIVSDINYPEAELYNKYKKYCKTVCLAPRGQGKYLADLAIKDVLFNDENPKFHTYNKNIFSGLKYVVTNDRYKIIKDKISKKLIKKNKNSLVIFMGGVDNENITNQILKNLSSISKKTLINVIIGSLNSNIDSIKKTIIKSQFEIKLYINPSNFYEIIASSQLGIFGAGITSYESAGLGTPPLNISISDFHFKRSLEMENLKIGVFLGDYENFNTNFSDRINYLLNKENFEILINNGTKLIDGNGADRVVEKILNSN